MKKTLIALFVAAVMVLCLIPASAGTIADGTMIYYEDFDAYANTNSNDETLATLEGWRILDLSEAYKDNTTTWTIKDQKLHAVGADDGSDSYMLFLETEDMWEVTYDNAWTLQYDIEQLATSQASCERYIVIVTHYAGYQGYANYCSFHLRTRGSANNQFHANDAWVTFDVAGDFYAADTNDDDGTTSVINKITGGTVKYAASTPAMINRPVTIRVQYPKMERDASGLGIANGPTVYVRDNSIAGSDFVKVSEYNEAGTAGTYYDVDINPGAGVVVKCTQKITATVDNIMIWIGNGDEPAVKTVTYVAPEMPADDTTEAPDDTTKASDDTTKAPGNDTTATPNDTTATPGGDTNAGDNTTETPADEGCASVVASGIALVAILGTAVVIKKRH